MPHTGFTNAYGLTETSSTVALLGPTITARRMPPPTPRSARASLRSASRCRRSNSKSAMKKAAYCRPAQAGEIYVRGDQVSGEYKERSALDAQGWFPTRDAGYLDEDGYLFLSGRADDVIVRGGENISPGEIEDVLLTDPAVCGCLRGGGAVGGMG